MAELVIDLAEYRTLTRRLRKMGGRSRALRTSLLEDLAGVLEAQTKRRISDEKRAPDGTPWRPWSAAYRKTRRAHHSLNVDTGNLLDDVFGEVAGATQVRVATSRSYAGAVQSFRPFMGLSSENEQELAQVALASLQELLA